MGPDLKPRILELLARGEASLGGLMLRLGAFRSADVAVDLRSLERAGLIVRVGAAELWRLATQAELASYQLDQEAGL